MNDEGREIEVRQAGRALPAAPQAAPPAWELDQAGPLFWTTLDATSDQGKALVMKAMGEPDVKADKVIGHTFLCAHVLAHGVEMEDAASGELREAVRSVLIGPEGRTLAFVSAGALKSLRLLIMLYGRGPWEPALPVKVNQVRTRKGFLTYTLTVDPAAVTARQPKGGRHGSA
jgi:hypothetical protein